MSKDGNLCLDKCKALCCTGISIPVDKPVTRKAAEELRFYIVHKKIRIYIRSHRWYILINEKCRNLGKDNLCVNYDNRPAICRTFSNHGCEYWGDYYDIIFNNEKELLEYLRRRGLPEIKKGRKKPIHPKPG